MYRVLLLLLPLHISSITLSAATSLTTSYMHVLLDVCIDSSLLKVVHSQSQRRQQGVPRQCLASQAMAERVR
jgi:hypothetical protein